MGLIEVKSQSRLKLPRETAAVVVPVFGSYDLYVQCMRSVFKHTPTEVPAPIADDASPDPQIRAFLDCLDSEGALRHTVYYLRQPENVGFVENMNAAFAVSGDADVVILNSDAVVPAGWFERLRDAACSDSLIATASALSNHGTIVSVPYRNRPQPTLPQEWSFEMAAEAVERQSPRLRPRIPTGIGHCLYVKRSALELVGDFDEAFSPGYGEEVDFCQRCVLAGLGHVVADDVLVLHHGMGSFSVEGERNPLQDAHDAIVSSRYPYYDQWIDSFARDDTVTLARSLDAASRAIEGLSITIDGRALGRFVTGTQVVTLELIAALAKRSDLRVRVVIPLELGDYARSVLDTLPEVGRMPAANVDRDTERTQIVHRPYQVSSIEDLELMAMLGERIVITQLDLISYFNPGYHSTFTQWSDHRALTKASLAIADQVVFISRHAARSAVSEGLIDPDRASVVYLGIDHNLAQETGPPQKPGGLGGIADRPFLLCLGTDFRHKNRSFALKLLKSLREQHDWDGAIVFAGAHVTAGSSAGSEAEFMAVNPQLEPLVVDVAAVDEPQKAWLFENAAAIVYPTVHEGFGLLPFEAAMAGAPSVFGANSALAELMPAGLALLVQWNAEESADKVISVLTDAKARERHVTAVRTAGAQLSWEQAATNLNDIYNEVALSALRPSKTLAMELSTLGYGGVAVEFGTNGRDRVDRMLVGPDGALPPEIRRALLAIGNRRFLRAVIFAPLSAIYRLGYRVKNRKAAPRQVETGPPPKQLNPGT